MAFEELRETVELYNCDRCGRSSPIAELIEDPATPGLLVHPERCADELGFNEAKAEQPRNDMGKNYFKT
jgi:hypothetical protein